MNNRNYLLLFFTLIVGVTGIDQWSKYLVLCYVEKNGLSLNQYLTSGNNVFDLMYATNTGAAFSLLPGKQNLLIIISVLALAFIFVYLLTHKVKDFMLVTSLGMIFGGALGNLIDRIFREEVIDFLALHWKEIYHWPTFNLADSFICIGVGLICLQLFKKEKPIAVAIASGDSATIPSGEEKQ